MTDSWKLTLPCTRAEAQAIAEDIAPLAILDPPPVPGLEEARNRLVRLGALDAEGRLTPHGRAIASWPLEPRLAHMMIEAEAHGFGSAVAACAALLTDRGLGGNDQDLEVRFRRWQADRGPRASAARNMARRWSSAGGS